jgi:hydrogenase-4 membrane subunit HyfE
MWDTASIIHFLSESAYLLIVFGVFLSLAVFKGRQALINNTCGMYLALLITVQFPYYDLLLKNLNQTTVIAAVKLIFFVLITILCTYLFKRLMPEEYREGKFETFGKKVMLSLGATILVMIFSFNVLPVTEFLVPGTPVQSLFAPQEYFFWWLLLPLVLIFIN